MIASHENDTASVVTGSSVHNERVERLWRDVHRCELITFAEIFQNLESEGYLDPLNQVDLFWLHYIFLPQINHNLLEFMGSWNHHKLSTEGNRTPYQLFFEGMLYRSNERNASQRMPEESYLSTLVDTHIQVPSNRFVPCQLLEASLLSINIQQDSQDNGQTLYIHNYYSTNWKSFTWWL